MNNCDRMKFDIIKLACKKGVYLKFKQSRNYATEIMSMINFIIDKVNEEYSEYEKNISTIFGYISKLP